MSEIRKDPITGRAVIIASERTERPREFDSARWTDLEEGFCPFCPGHEEATPPDIATFDRGVHEADWSVRVVPNKYPALSADATLVEHEDGLLTSLQGVGAHEVIIETPDHIGSLGAVSEEQMAMVLRAWGSRLRDLQGDDRLEYGLIFKNRGADAGASLEHAHSQLIALPLVPDVIREELHGARVRWDEHGDCPFCRLVEVGDQHDRRVVANEDVVAFAPYAPRCPFEMRVMPRHHNARFESEIEDSSRAVADILHRLIGKLDRALEHPPYNLVLHTAPLDADELDHYHWHIELIPALSYIAGFEWGTGCHINPTPPERAAEHLRGVPESD